MGTQDVGWLAELEGRFVLDEPLFFKATPHTEGDRRLIYCEPSNENVDAQREALKQAALIESAALFRKFGVLDLDHKSLLGERMGMTAAQARSYIIGRPEDVIVEPRILVKGEIFRGDAPHLENANFFWASLTEQIPPLRWYPSVGGRTLAKHEAPDGTTVVDKVAWTNLAFAQEPVNRSVQPVQVMPFDEFYKAVTGIVTAGHETDVAKLEGGQAVQEQSIQGGLLKYQDAAARYLKALGTDACEHTAGTPTLAKLVSHFQRCAGASADQAKAYAARLIRDIATRRQRQSHTAKEAA